MMYLLIIFSVAHRFWECWLGIWVICWGLASHQCFQCSAKSPNGSMGSWLLVFKWILGLLSESQNAHAVHLKIIMMLLPRDANQSYIYRLNVELLTESLDSRWKLYSRSFCIRCGGACCSQYPRGWMSDQSEL